MCPNQFLESTLLPDCRISSRVFMYSLLQSLQAEERSSDEVDVQLRDRYEVFCQLLSNYPMPLHQNSRFGLEVVTPVNESTDNLSENLDYSDSSCCSDCSDALSLSSCSGSSSANSSFSEEDLSARCDFYQEAVRSTLDELVREENNNY